MYISSHICEHWQAHVQSITYVYTCFQTQKKGYTPPVAHRYTSSHTSKLPHHQICIILGIHAIAGMYVLPYTCAHHMYMPLGTHACSVRQTYELSGTPCSGLGCYTLIRATWRLRSPCWDSHRSNQDTGSQGPWANPALDLPHVLPQQGSALRLRPVLFQAPW